MKLETRPVSPALGVEILNLDLACPLSDEIAAALRALYGNHHLLLLRGQTIEAEAQVRFAEVIGPISHRAPSMQNTSTAFVSNARPDGILGDGELYFHSDNTFFEHPLKAIGLYAMELPPSGGDTLFSNCAAVYDALPSRLKERLEGLTSYQLFDYGGRYDYNRRSRDDEAAKDAIRAVHPIVWTEPESGRKVLFMSEHTTVRINELPEAEGEALIAELRRWIADPRFGYRHKWRVGDMLLWDNVILQHAREPFDKTARRTLRRTPIADPDGKRRFPNSRAVAAAPAAA